MKKYTLTNTEKEAHMMGDIVAVCWNIKRIEKSLKKDGLTYKATVWERSDEKPYIDFIQIREYEDGYFCEDKYKPVEGGISVKRAERIRDELGKALEYVKSL